MLSELGGGVEEDITGVSNLIGSLDSGSFTGAPLSRVTCHGNPSLLSLRSLPERQPAGPFEKRSFVNPTWGSECLSPAKRFTIRNDNGLGVYGYQSS